MIDPRSDKQRTNNFDEHDCSIVDLSARTHHVEVASCEN